MIKKLLFSLIVFIYSCLQATSTTLSDDARISVLTVYPRTNAIYAIFGHTAVRIQDPQLQMDMVFNYGTFDSSQPYFIYHFVKGETDYSLSTDEFPEFKYRYMMWGATIKEQVLNLSPEARQDIYNFMINNALPQNREYRYDYFFDNCVTRPRDIIEKYAGGKIIYPQTQHHQTFRKLVHDYTKNFPWTSFGIDLVLGMGADSTIALRQEMFLPIKLMEAFDQSEIDTNGGEYPLVATHYTIAEQTFLHEEGKNIFTPVRVASFFLLFILAISVCSFNKRKSLRILDFIIFLIAGLSGCIVAFIAFISSHPCTSGNLNLLWLHPLHLITAIFFIIKARQKFQYWYHLFNFAVLTVFLLTYYILPQSFPAAGIVFAAILWIRSGEQLIRIRRSRYVEQV